MRGKNRLNPAFPLKIVWNVSSVVIECDASKFSRKLAATSNDLVWISSQLKSPEDEILNYLKAIGCCGHKRNQNINHHGNLPSSRRI